MVKAISIKSLFLFSLLQIFWGMFSVSMAGESEINTILAQEVAPVGVVFEVVSGDEAYLKTALDNFEIYQQQLKAKFPDIGLAIVSHGSEQFSLTKNNQVTHADTHNLVKRIIKTDVPVHVCGGHAKWRDLSDEDFPDYVEVSPSGPAEVKAYQEKGYILVFL